MKWLQKEHKAWVDVLCPNQPLLLPAAGMVEEAGELLHVAIAMFRVEHWGPEKRYPDLRGDLCDALADCAIYACSYCNAKGWEFHRFWDAAPQDAAGRNLIGMSVDLVRIAAEFTVQQYTDTLMLYMSLLHRIALSQGVVLEEAVKTAWDIVKRRTR